MPSAQPMISKVNLEKPPQYAIEGTTPAAYAAPIEDAVFTAPTNLSEIEDGLDNQFIDSKFGGTLDNKGKIKVRETNQITLKGRLLPTAECMELLEWSTNIYPGGKASYKLGTSSDYVLIEALKPGEDGNKYRITYSKTGTADAITVSGNVITIQGGSGGRSVAQIANAINTDTDSNVLVSATVVADDSSTKPDAVTTQALEGGTKGGKDGPKESRTWLVSYNDNTGTEIYRIARGCKPMTANVVFSKEDTVMLEITCSCKDYYETPASGIEAAGLTGSPSYAIAEPSADGLTYEDLGDFHYKPILNAGDKTKNKTTALIFRGGNVQVTWGQRKQDSNGAIKDWFRDYGSRSGAGSFEIFKTGHKLNEDARKADQFVGWIDIQYIGTGTKGTSSEQSETIAKATATDTNGVNVYSKLPGSAGNDITFRILAPSRTAQNQVRVNGHDIDLVPKSGGDTVANLVTALNNDKLANNLITAEAKGTTTTNINAAVPRVTCSGGISRWRRIIMERMKWEPSTESMLKDENDATIESKSLMADAVIAATT